MNKKCSFCDEDIDANSADYVALLTNSVTGRHICETCATGAHSYYQIVRINLVAAMKESAMAPDARDADGNCTCPRCIFRRKMEASVFRAEDTTQNAPTTDTRQ